MDKYEYKLRSEEIKSLIKEREFVKAVEIADTIDWSRVRSVSMLCTISDLYKINRRYKEAKDILVQAYEKNPGGRTILYSLCELCIKTDDVIGAIEYYKEYVQLAPMDSGKFVLQYKIYEAQDVSLEERIAVLEELKKRDYREKWGYELAYLYHRIGLGTKCVEECDELILWFREGKYIKKAMELKMLHQQLTQEQEVLYKNMIPAKEQEQYEQQTRVYEGGAELPVTENIGGETVDIQVKPVDVSQYNTINLQKALAESMKEVLVADNAFAPLYTEEMEIPTELMQEVSAPAENAALTEEEEAEEIIVSEEPEDNPAEEVVLEEENEEELIPIEDEYPAEQLLQDDPIEITTYEEEEAEEEEEYVPGSITEAIMAPMFADTDILQELIVSDGKIVAEEVKNVIPKERPSIREVMQGKNTGLDLSNINPPEGMGRLLSQEYDGQISLVMPEEEKVEKQITGQMNLEDILAEWEKTKKDIEEKHKNQIRQRVLDQTGTMFTEFEAKVRDGILEKLENDEDVDVLQSVADENLPEEINEELPAVEELEEITEDMDEEPETENEALQAEQDVANEEFEELEEIPEEAAEEAEEMPLSEEELPMTDESLEESVYEEEPVREEPEVAKDQKGTESQRERDSEQTRNMSEEEILLFAPFVQTKGARIRLMQSLDQISLAAYTGNVFVTGETADEAVELAKSVVKEVQMTDRNFSGKVAKVTGFSLNNRDIESMVEKLANGALIVEQASGMDAQTTKDLLRALNQEKTGIVVVLQDTKKAMHKMMEYFGGMKEVFNVHIEVEELGDDALVAYGKKYARYLEYTIDEMGVLALHTRIEEMQTSDHIVTVADVREIVDEAIDHANRKNLKHFADLLLAKRYDDEDMIILREKDFLY